MAEADATSRRCPRLRERFLGVVGPRFDDPHKFFEAQHEALDAIIDELAERARALGGRAVGTLAEFTKLARLKEHPIPAGLTEQHEKMAWMLRSFLEGR
jgi:DNA-binding ferritin-like protein